MQSLRKKKYVWELVELPKDQTAVVSKWYLNSRLIPIVLLNVTRSNLLLKVFLKSMVWITMKRSPQLIDLNIFEQWLHLQYRVG